MAELKATADPRVVGGEDVLDRPAEVKPVRRREAGGDSSGTPHPAK
jgi:hypothetical protein